MSRNQTVRELTVQWQDCGLKVCQCKTGPELEGIWVWDQSIVQRDGCRAASRSGGMGIQIPLQVCMPWFEYDISINKQQVEVQWQNIRRLNTQQVPVFWMSFGRCREYSRRPARRELQQSRQDQAESLERGFKAQICRLWLHWWSYLNKHLSGVVSVRQAKSVIQPKYHSMEKKSQVECCWCKMSKIIRSGNVVGYVRGGDLSLKLDLSVPRESPVELVLLTGKPNPYLDEISQYVACESQIIHFKKFLQFIHIWFCPIQMQFLS